MFMLLKFSWFFIHIKLRTNQYFENLFFCVIFSLILKVFNYVSIADFKIRVLKQMLENVDLHVFIFHFDICFTFDPSNPIPFQHSKFVSKYWNYLNVKHLKPVQMQEHQHKRSGKELDDKKIKKDGKNEELNFKEQYKRIGGK